MTTKKKSSGTRGVKATRGKGARGGGGDDTLTALIAEVRMLSPDTQKSILATTRKYGNRVPPPVVETVADAHGTEYPKPPPGTRYAREECKHQGWCPDQWSDGVMIYPPGSARVLDPAPKRFTKAQWDLAVKMLDAGFVVGFSTYEAEEADLARIVSVKPGTVALWEGGWRSPNRDGLVRVAHALRRKLDWLCFGGADYWWRRRPPERD